MTGRGSPRDLPRRGPLARGGRAWALALALLPACRIAEYTVGGALSGGASDGSTDDPTGAETCPDGQVACGDGCAPAGECDDCPPGQVRCDDACVPEGECEEDPSGCLEGQVPCGDGCAPADACPCEQGCDPELEVCDGEACRCRPGLVRCGAACVDTRSDPEHCDACDAACDAEAACQGGECVAACEAPAAACDGACVDLATDSLHCGDCGKLCLADEVCLSGQCRPYVPIDGCAACPCAEACEAGETAGEQQYCCDSPFLGDPVCVQFECP